MLRTSLPALATFAAVSLHPIPTSAAEGPIGLEALLSAPHPSGLVAASAAARIAWVSNREGVRNVWVAEGPSWAGRPLTAYASDDGQGLVDLELTQDGRHLLYVRGGGPNREQEHPNPESDPEGVEQAVWIVPFEGGEPRKLAASGSFRLSPAGDRVAYVKEGEVWTVPLEAPPASEPSEEAPGPEDNVAEGGPNGEEAQGAERLFTVRRGVDDLAWSPDGTKIAFVSDRGDHAFVGVYDLEGGSLSWLDPSVDRDGSPAWSPDGRWVAFVRIPNEEDVLPFMPRREGLPWSIRVADAATGEGREVFRAEPGRGSAFGAGYWYAGERLLWGEGDRLVFPWERTGWLHLWSVAAAGGSPVDLTPGEGEVQFAELAPGGREVVYASNHGDLERRHLWRVAVGAPSPRQLTAGDGIEWSPALPAGGGVVAFLASGARTPAHPEIVVSGERRRLDGPSPPPGFPSEALVEPRAVRFPAADGLEVRGQLFPPPARCGGGPHPGLLFFHGGSRRQMLLGFHPRGYYHNAYAFNQHMASRCFVVLSVNYRSGVGYGLDFREALEYGARGASEYADVVGAGLYLASRADVDGARIGLWGGSYGGYLTALGLARASDLFAAGVDLHGVHDWNAVIANFVRDYDPEERRAAADLARASSPIAFLDGWRSPVLLIHGDDDRNVPFSESVTLVEALRRRGVTVEHLVFPDEVHGFLLHRSWLTAYRRAAAFLERTLAAAP